MNIVSFYPPPYTPSSSDYRSFQIAQSSRTSLDARANAAISQVTTDGDKVTLSASSALLATHSTYDYLGRLDGQTIAARVDTLSISRINNVAVAVEGEFRASRISNRAVLASLLV